MKVIFCGYRSWAIKAFEVLKNNPKVQDFIIVNDESALLECDHSQFDLLLTLGWSWELPEQVLQEIPAFGLHCAELDRYSYGTPIQNQIIDGLTVTKHRVFPFLSASGSKRAHTHTREFSHEVDLSLHGRLSDVFEQLSSTAVHLYSVFLEDYPDLTFKKWPEEDVVCPPRIPEQSKISKNELSRLSALELYNLIRCLADPYPNLQIEDETGTLYFKDVGFKHAP